MKQINKGIICLLSGMALFVSCNDEWDAHYDRNGSVPQVSLMDLLRNDASLSTFTQIVEITGTDSLLVSNQTYTVWAPVNEALTNVDMTDRAALERLVKNHIARYTNRTEKILSTSNMNEAKPYLTFVDGQILYGRQKGKKVYLYA